MPKCLHVIHVAVEIETDKLSVLDGTIRAMQEAAEGAVKLRAQLWNDLGTSKIEVIE